MNPIVELAREDANRDSQKAYYGGETLSEYTAEEYLYSSPAYQFLVAMNERRIYADTYVVTFVRGENL